MSPTLAILSVHSHGDRSFLDDRELALVSGELAAGYDPARPSAFSFRGLAIGDFAIACLAYEKASSSGKGTLVGW